MPAFSGFSAFRGRGMKFLARNVYAVGQTKLRWSNAIGNVQRLV